ncbi:MAG: hypothetical protein U1F43_10065 [Myxococcota bacterium]
MGAPYAWDASRLRTDEKRDLVFRDPNDGWQVKLDIGLADDLGGGRTCASASTRCRPSNCASSTWPSRGPKLRCTVVWGAFKNAYQSALAYLLYSPRRGDARAVRGVQRDLKSGFRARSDHDGGAAASATGRALRHRRR